MKPIAATALSFAALGLAAAFAQSSGSFTTSVAWNPQPEATGGFHLFLGNGAPGIYFTNYVVPAGTTNFVFHVAPGTTYRSAIQAHALDGRESALSPEIVWTTPALLASPTGYRTTVTVYVP
jgi:hypothetical protein